MISYNKFQKFSNRDVIIAGLDKRIHWITLFNDKIKKKISFWIRFGESLSLLLDNLFSPIFSQFPSTSQYTFEFINIH